MTDTGSVPAEPAPRPVPEAAEPVRCSAKGCRAGAAHLIVWNNPRVHAPDREKTWAACAEHRDSLAGHLDVRGFLLRVEPLRSACPRCQARFPAEQRECPVCADVRGGRCGGRD